MKCSRRVIAVIDQGFSCETVVVARWSELYESKGDFSGEDTATTYRSWI